MESDGVENEAMVMYSEDVEAANEKSGSPTVIAYYCGLGNLSLLVLALPIIALITLGKI